MNTPAILKYVRKNKIKRIGSNREVKQLQSEENQATENSSKNKDLTKITANQSDSNKSNVARDVGIEPTRPFDHRLSRPAPYQAWGIPHAIVYLFRA
jgi:hypothetical protein